MTKSVISKIEYINVILHQFCHEVSVVSLKIRKTEHVSLLKTNVQSGEKRNNRYKQGTQSLTIPERRSPKGVASSALAVAST